MVSDQFNTEFDNMVMLADSMVYGAQVSGSRILAFDIGGSSLPYCMLCLKCRDVKIRRRAIAILEISPEREGIWHRKSVFRYSGWKFEAEERGREGFPETAPLPESARIYHERPVIAVVDGEQVIVMHFTKGVVGSGG